MERTGNFKICWELAIANCNLKNIVDLSVTQVVQGSAFLGLRFRPVPMKNRYLRTLSIPNAEIKL